ncbi:MAG: GTPase ObgE, partial [Candidatus Zixiibacteriota bacterium]
FLRHIQRTKILVYVVDVNEPDIKTTLRTLQRELKEFDPYLLNKPSLITITKIDTKSESDLEKLSKKLPPDYIYISAVAGKGLNKFLQEIEKQLDQLRD